MNNPNLPPSDTFNEFSNRFEDPELNTLVHDITAGDLLIHTDTNIGHVAFNDFFTAALLGNLELPEFELNNPRTADSSAKSTRTMLEREIEAREKQRGNESGKIQLETKLAMVQRLYDYIRGQIKEQPDFETDEVNALKIAAHAYLFPKLALNILNAAGGRHDTDPEEEDPDDDIGIF